MNTFRRALVAWKMPVVFAVALAAAFAQKVQPDWPAEEARLLDVLRSDRPMEEKDAACVQLHHRGSDRAVPALAALLNDPQLAHSARYVLESLASPAAGQALVAALETTSGEVQLGLINSLVVRREVAAVPALTRLIDGAAGSASIVGSPDAVACAAAAALGAIDDPAARRALEAARARATGARRDAVVDALLRHGRRSLAAGQSVEARQLFLRLQENEPDESLRWAAWQWHVRASGGEGGALVLVALTGPSQAGQQAALKLLPELPEPGFAAAFGRVLPTLPPARQAALITGWTRRLASPPLTVVAPFLSSSDAGVRLAALRALGRVGGGTVVGALVDAAAAQPGPEQKAARLALTEMTHQDVPRMLLALLADPVPTRKAEAARALGERGDQAAVAPLLELARDDEAGVRTAALRALVLLLNENQVGRLIELVVATADAKRAETARALALVYERLQPKQGSTALQPLLPHLAGGPAETRVALLAVCGSIAAPEVRSVLRLALSDPTPEIRAAAVRSVCRTVDPELLGDVMTLATRASEEDFRELATRACVRLTTAPGTKVSRGTRWEVLQSIAATPTNTTQKRALLLGLAEGRTVGELALAETLAGDPSVQAEAAAVIVKIASRVADASAAGAALQRLQPAAGDPELRKEIEVARRGVEARAAYVTSWQTAPAFRVAAARADDLLDAAFAPERNWTDYNEPAARARVAAWEPMAVATNPRYPMSMRGGSTTLFGVAYAYTWVRSVGPREVQLEVDHDDAVKMWLNGKPVLSSAARPPSAPPQPERMPVALNAGWNLLLLKIAQPAKPWAFSVRFLGAGGQPRPEIVADATAGPGS